MSELQQSSDGESSINERYDELVAKAYAKADSIEELEALLGY